MARGSHSLDLDVAIGFGRFRLVVAEHMSIAGVTAVFGPSGCGKSTLLRVIAGLEGGASGHVRFDGAPWQEGGRVLVPTHRRRVGVIFQDARLFPHLTVAGNLAYAARRALAHGPAPSEAAIIESLDLGPLLNQRPATLSGGERQRVAIGRALLAAPQLLLMDEPLAALDAARKLEILTVIEQVRDRFGVPILYVSHAIEEVTRLASHVIRLKDGQVVGRGEPGAVLSEIVTAVGSDRFDAVSQITGRLARIEAAYGASVLAHPAGEIVLPFILPGAQVGAAVRLAVRATNVTLAVRKPQSISIRTALAGRVTRVTADGGPFALVSVELIGGERMLAYITRLALAELGLDTGDDVVVLLKAVAIDERGITALD